MFRHIANSDFIKDSERAIKELKISEYWKSDQLLRNSNSYAI